MARIRRPSISLKEEYASRRQCRFERHKQNSRKQCLLPECKCVDFRAGIKKLNGEGVVGYLADLSNKLI
jgi:hypothetical protein